MQDLPSFSNLSDTDLRAAVAESAASERTATANLIALLAEYDQRRLYLADDFPSLFQFCVTALHLSESAAFSRIQAARASRKWPAVLQALRDGSVTLTAVGLLAPHLTDANCVALLTEARHQPKSAVERIVARLAPKPDAASLLRRLPCRVVAEPAAVDTPAETITASSTSVSPAGSAAQISMTAATRPKVDKDTRQLLRQAQDLMRHVVPSGDPAVVVTRALRVLVDHLLRTKAAATAHPRDASVHTLGSRAIPAAVQRAVWKRDGGRCTFEGLHGRCRAQSPLEYHHVIPFAMGGPSMADNIALRCRAHNLYQARLDGLGWEPAVGDEAPVSNV